MYPIEKFSKKTPEEKNRVYLTIILFCVFLALLLCIAILSMVFPELHASTEKKDGNAADSAASEISAGLLVKSEDTLSSALSYVETYYATTPSDKRSELAAKRFTRLFYQELRDLAAVEARADEEHVETKSGEIKRVKVAKAQMKEDENSAEQTFREYLESFIPEKRGAVLSSSASNVYIACSEEEHYVEIQNRMIECRDGSSRTTNIRFYAPKEAAGDSAESYAGAVNAYAVVADGNVLSTGGKNRIDGSVYAGTSIQAQAGGQFDIRGDTTVTRGDISSSGAALLNIMGDDVWASNIRTVNNGASSSSASAGLNMDIVADCFISGDLVLENPGYDVDINGNYFGYGTREDAYDGSMVDANTKNAIDGTEMDAILRRLLEGSYTILTNEDGTTTTFISDEALAAARAEAGRQASEAAMAAGGSTIRITGSGASTLIAYSRGQTLWLAATEFFSKAGVRGRESIDASNVPNGLSAGQDDTNATNLETLYTHQFNGLISALDKNASTSSPNYSLAAHLTDLAGLTGKTVIYTESSHGSYEMHELETTKGTGGDYIAIMPKSEYHTGVLIADCDVRIANTDFNGIILTTGDVIMTGGALIRSDYGEARFTGVADTLLKNEKKDSESRVTAELVESEETK